MGLAYVEHYRARARAVLSELGYSRILGHQDSGRAFEALLNGAPQRRAVRKLIAGSLLKPRREHFDRAVLLHTSHNGMERLRYYKAMRRRNVSSVFMVHDLIPLTHAEFCRPGVEEAHRRRIHTALQYADGLIANSQDTLEALNTESRKAGLPMPPSIVARLAPAVTSRQCGAAPIDTPYFVMLGTIEPRKNHWFMLQVWRRLVETLGDRAPKLVIIGRRGWEYESVLDMLERCGPIRNVVIEESECDDNRLRAWLLHARALLFPSFVEGYGMPLVEALTLGVPALASDLAVFHEIAGDIPDYLDPLDGPGWQRLIVDYVESGSRSRDAQCARMSNFKVPTWREHFECVDRFIDTLAG